MHAGFATAHPLHSSPWSWFSVKQSALYYADRVGESAHAVILAFGSPFVWGLALLTIAYIASQVILGRRPDAVDATTVVGFTVTYGASFVVGAFRPVAFWHVLPATPYLCLAVGYLAARAGRSRVARLATATYAAVAVALFAFAYPLLTARPVALRSWRSSVAAFYVYHSSLLSCSPLERVSSPAPGRPRPC
jgi:dolichyl-phosphate-mannose--protein O-mannosyl transferase